MNHARWYRSMFACAALALAFGATSPAGADVTIASPLSAAAPATRDAVTPLALDPAAPDLLRIHDRVTLVGFPLDGDETVTLVLRRREVFSEDARLVRATPRGEIDLPRPEIVLLSGHVEGDSDSLVVLGLTRRGAEGVIRRGADLHVIATPPAARRGGTVIFNLRTLPEGAIDWKPWTCLAETLDDSRRPRPATGGGSGGGSAAMGGPEPPCRVVEVAVDTDNEFTTDLFADDALAAADYVALLFAAASEIYARDVNSRFVISYLRIWDGFLVDPWDETSTTSQLVQFRLHWEDLMTSVRRDVAHFLSGRELGGGVAYLPGICQVETGYGLSANINGHFPYPLEDHNSQNWDIVVVTHELGHNFGAPHTHSHIPPIDNCGNGDCTGAANGTIMSYCHQCPGGIANFNLRFHPAIVDNMIGYLANEAPCNLVNNSGPDLDHDGSVGPVDLAMMIGAWGPCPSPVCHADLDCNGEVAVTDLLGLLASWDG